MFCTDFVIFLLKHSEKYFSKLLDSDVGTVCYRCWCRQKIVFIVLVSRTQSPCSTSLHVTQLMTISGTVSLTCTHYLYEFEDDAADISEFDCDCESS